MRRNSKQSERDPQEMSIHRIIPNKPAQIFEDDRKKDPKHKSNYTALSSEELMEILADEY